MLDDKILRVIRQHASCATALDDLKAVVGARERPEQRAKVTGLCKVSSTTSLTATFLALPAARGVLKICCEVSTLKTKCISGFAAEVEELRGRLSDRETTNTAADTNPKGPGQTRATAAGKRLFALEARLVEAKDAPARLVDIAAQSKHDAVETQADL